MREILQPKYGALKVLMIYEQRYGRRILYWPTTTFRGTCPKHCQYRMTFFEVLLFERWTSSQSDAVQTIQITHKRRGNCTRKYKAGSRELR